MFICLEIYLHGWILHVVTGVHVFYMIIRRMKVVMPKESHFDNG